jgi:hypothetical protein
MAFVGHFVDCHDMVLRIYGHLDVVANDARSSTAGGHRSSVWVSHRELAVGRLLQLLFDALQPLHLISHRLELLLQMLDLCLELRRWKGAIRRVQRIQVPFDALFDLLLALSDACRA